MAVTESGLIFNTKTGNLVKPQIILKDADYPYVDKILVQYKYKGKRRTRTQQRLIYKAWNPDFDIDDQNLVVVSTTEDRFETDVTKLKVITRDEHYENLAELATKFTDADKEAILDKWEEVQGLISKKRFCRAVNMTPEYLNLLIKKRENDSKL